MLCRPHIAWDRKIISYEKDEGQLDLDTIMEENFNNFLFEIFVCIVEAATA